eukprot:13564844-Heterocapsa_arctica.AAC.1
MPPVTPQFKSIIIAHLVITETRTPHASTYQSSNGEGFAFEIEVPDVRRPPTESYHNACRLLQASFLSFTA